LSQFDGIDSSYAFQVSPWEKMLAADRAGIAGGGGATAGVRGGGYWRSVSPGPNSGGGSTMSWRCSADDIVDPAELLVHRVRVSDVVGLRR
jgi:hypothetical protein